MEPSSYFGVYLYYSGKMVKGASGIEYTKEAEGFIMVDQNTTYDALIGMVASSMKINLSAWKIKLVYRCPRILQPSVASFFPMSITSDEHVQYMISWALKHSSYTGEQIDLYVSKERIGGRQSQKEHISSQLSMGVESQHFSEHPTLSRSVGIGSQSRGARPTTCGMGSIN